MKINDYYLQGLNYFHHSARDQDELDTHRDAAGFADFVGNASRYDEERKVKREVYRNITSKAILPLHEDV